jgi:hypothetical protein
MIRKSLALMCFAILLSLQPIGASTAHAEDPVTLSDLSPGAELAFWNKIKESGDIADFATYLQNFPNGMFYDLALEKFQGMGGNPSDLRDLASVNPAKPPVEVAPILPKKTVAKTTIKKKQATRPVCPITKRLVGNSCRVVVKKVKVAKPKLVRIAKKLPKKKVYHTIRSDGAGGDGGGGGGGWN